MKTSNTTSQIRSLIGCKRISPKMSLVDVCTKVLEGISNRCYEGSYPCDLYNAAYGILHGLQTGRVDGSYASAVSKISGVKAANFVLSIAEKQLSGDDVSRYLNGRPFQWNGERWVARYN